MRLALGWLTGWAAKRRGDARDIIYNPAKPPAIDCEGSMRA